MDESDDLLSTFWAMNQDGRNRLRSLAKRMQKHFAADRRPSLTLVKNTNDVKILDGVLDGSVDHRTVIRTGETIYRK